MQSSEIKDNKSIINTKKDLNGQVIIITGANQGIGKETVRGLAKTGATIVLACRDKAKTIPTIDEIRAETKDSNLEFMKLDLSDLKSVREFADEFKAKYQKLDILINNAGILSYPERHLTKDGFEMHFGTNHLGHFYLTLLLLDVIKKSAPSRIINVSSNMNAKGKMRWDDLNMEKKYDLLDAYSQSKLANVLFTKELQKRLEESNVKVVSLHPGVVNTNMQKNPPDIWYYKLVASIVRLFAIAPEEGAKTSLYCALEEHSNLKGGAYYDNCKVAKENPMALKEENWTKLWDISEKMVNSKI